MRIEVYLDKAETPFRVLTPPEKFDFDTAGIVDGPHELRFVATDNAGISSIRVVPFTVQNGPAIAVHGVTNGDTLSGSVSLLANAYGTKFADEFEPLRMETPVSVPTWAWVLFLGIVAWGAGYLALELSNRDRPVFLVPVTATAATAAGNASAASWVALGEQVYGNNCLSCHQAAGTGLPGVFPPLVSNPAVIDADPQAHISAIINGVTGKVIDGVNYAAPMPPFGSALSDDEIAAVVNHERTQWGNDAPLVSAEDVAALR